MPVEHYRRKPTVDIDAIAAQVHDAYLVTCDRLGWSVRPENRVPYDELSEESKELDRATVRAVLAALHPPADRLTEDFDRVEAP